MSSRGLESESVPISGSLYLNLGRLLRTSRNSLGPLRSLRLRRCRSSSVADGSLRRSISWPAIARAFSILSVRTPARWALGPCSVAMIDLHSSQMMSATVVVFLIVRLHRVEYHRLRLIAGGAPTWGNRASRFLMEAHSPNEARALFHNSRTIGFARERRDGDGQQLAGGDLGMCRCWWPLCHGHRLGQTLRLSPSKER
jgi:hypothetical protein